MRDAMTALEELVGIMATRYCRSYTHPPCEGTRFQRVLWEIWGLREGGAPHGEVEYCANQLCLATSADFGEVYDFVWGSIHAEEH